MKITTKILTILAIAGLIGLNGCGGGGGADPLFNPDDEETTEVNEDNFTSNDSDDSNDQTVEYVDDLYSEPIEDESNDSDDEDELLVDHIEEIPVSETETDIDEETEVDDEVEEEVADEVEDEVEDEVDDEEDDDDNHEQPDPVFPLVADTYIDSNSSHTNFGDLTYAMAGTATWGSTIKAVFLKFDISQLPLNQQISSATLKLYLGDEPYCSNIENIASYHIIDDSWGEYLLVFQNNPCNPQFNNSNKCNLQHTDTKAVGSASAEWDVTEMVAEDYEDGDSILSIMLKGEGPGQCDKPFVSRENEDETKHPTLEIEYE